VIVRQFIYGFYLVPKNNSDYLLNHFGLTVLGNEDSLFFLGGRKRLFRYD